MKGWYNMMERVLFWENFQNGGNNKNWGRNFQKRGNLPPALFSNYGDRVA